MKNSDSKRIKNIIERSELINELVNDGFERFIQSNYRIAALERWVEVIGEASTNLTHSYREKCKDIDWSQIISMRNRLAHKYEAISYERLWNIAKFDIPFLIFQLKENSPAG